MVETRSTRKRSSLLESPSGSKTAKIRLIISDPKPEYTSTTRLSKAVDTLREILKSKGEYSNLEIAEAYVEVQMAKQEASECKGSPSDLHLANLLDINWGKTMFIEGANKYIEAAIIDLKEAPN